jgi:Ran GTPase-activating protein (RanGAP) involved in mRNA processing and transport
MSIDLPPKLEAKDWTRKALLDILDADTPEAGLERLRRMGVLDEHNNLTERVTNWGADYVSHTLVEGDNVGAEGEDDEDDEDEEEDASGSRLP